MNKCKDCYYYTDEDKEVMMPQPGSGPYNFTNYKEEMLRMQECHYDRVTIDTTPDNYCKDYKAND